MFTYGRDKANLSGRTVAHYVLSALLILLAMLFYIYPSISSTSLMYEYSKVTRQLSERKELNKKMKLELSTLRSYDFIEKRAMNDLGFVFPAQGQVVIIAKK